MRSCATLAVLVTVLATASSCAPAPATRVAPVVETGVETDAPLAVEPAPTYDGASERWTSIKARIRREFPDVETITVDELAAHLDDAGGRAPLLFDVREEEEYAVSHLEGARRSRTRSEALDLLRSVPREREIVVYCSVGYRSAELAAGAVDAGFTNVRNLEGSIFEWANAGRPLVRGSEPADAVHPYDAHWGELLRPELRASLAPGTAPRER